MRKVIEAIIGSAKKKQVEDVCLYLKQTFTPTFKIDNVEALVQTCERLRVGTEIQAMYI